MPDYDWFSAESIRVATEGIRAEAKKWYEFSDKMESIAQNMANLTLASTAFSVIGPSNIATNLDLHNAYSTTQQWLTNLFREATEKFEQFGDALRKCADEYERTDGRSAASFDRIARS